MNKKNGKGEEGEKEVVVQEIEPPRKLQLGARDIPIGMFRGKLEERLLERINEIPMFSCEKGSELKRKFGFSRCQDYVGVRKHYQYEGFFHSLETSQQISCMEPRFGENQQTPAAPPFLRAFFIALREKNSAWLKEICQQLKNKANIETETEQDGEKEDKGKEPQETFKPTPPNEYIKAFANLLDPNPPPPSIPRPFSDLAIQVHYGTPITNSIINFHFDQPNSVLHMALSLHGSRKLHSMRDDVVSFFDQRRGDLYVTSPHYFIHGVEYPSCGWEERVVAIQARLLFLDNEEMAGIKKLRKGEGEERIVGEEVGRKLLEGMEIPTYEEVVCVYRRLEDGGE